MGLSSQLGVRTMLRHRSVCFLWLWLLPVVCRRPIQFSSFRGLSEAQEGDLRLAGSSRPSEGRVEIYHGGQWGTVCDDGWDLNEAKVVCRQLRFPGAKSVSTGEEAYGKASGPIWMDDTECTGTEKYLNVCKFGGWGATDCTHKEDVGVVCETAEGTLQDSSHVLDHRIVLSDEMEELFSRGAFCDLSITAQSSPGDDRAGTEKTTETTLCVHRAILSHVDAFNITQNTSSITVQVVEYCMPYFPLFVRYLYSRKVEATYSSVQCLHWLASKFGVDELKRDCGLLFNKILPEDRSFEMPVSMHEYAVETNDVVLQEICVQYMAWNFHGFSQSPAWPQISADLLTGLLVRSDLVVPEEVSVLKAVEHWILINANGSLDTAGRLLSLVRFSAIPAEKLTPSYLLSNSSLYSTHKAIFNENILKALQFNVQLFSNLKSKRSMSVDDVSYQPRIYTSWSASFSYSNARRYDGQSRVISAPYHSSLAFMDKKIQWGAALYSTQYQCSNGGVRCSALPMARLVRYDATSQPAVVFRNRLLVICEGGYVGHVYDFKNGAVYLSDNVTQSMAYPCRLNEHKQTFVVRPEFH